jgi:hypothetical protein
MNADDGLRPGLLVSRHQVLFNQEYTSLLLVKMAQRSTIVNASHILGAGESGEKVIDDPTTPTQWNPPGILSHSSKGVGFPKLNTNHSLMMWP